MEVELPEQLLAMTAQLAEPEAAAKAREGHAGGGLSDGIAGCARGGGKGKGEGGPHCGGSGEGEWLSAVCHEGVCVMNNMIKAGSSAPPSRWSWIWMSCCWS